MDTLHGPVFVENVDGFDIFFTAETENIDPKDSFDDENILEQIYNGNLTWFVAKISAHKAGIELGTAYLDGCSYNSYEDFYTTYRDDYYTGMRAEVIREAKESVTAITT